MKQFSQAVDQNGQPVAGAFPVSDTINAMDFTGAGAKTATVPAGAHVVVFGASQNVDIFVRLTSAAVPGADVTDGSASEANPSMRQVPPGGTIGVAVSAACIVTLSYFG